MFNSSEEIYFSVILTAIVMAFLVSVFLASVIRYQKRLHRHRQEKKDMETRFTETLLQTQLEIQAQTMNNISQEIHDNVGQVLSLAKLNLARLYSQVVEKETAGRIDATRELVGQAIGDLRSLARGLNIDYIAETGFVNAIRAEMQKVEKSDLFTAKVEVAGAEFKLSKQQELIIFRIFQESLNNAIKHSNASVINVLLNYSYNQFKLAVADNGKGFNPALKENKQGLGLNNMKSRAEIIGATFTVSSGSDGTVCEISLPILPNASHASQ